MTLSTLTSVRSLIFPAGLSALLAVMPGCGYDRQESVGEEIREASQAIDDGADEFAEQTKDVFQAIGDDRTALEKRIDKATRDIEKRAEKAGDAITRESRDAWTALDSEARSLRDDLDALTEKSGEQLKKAQQSIAERAEELERAIAEMGEPK